MHENIYSLFQRKKAKNKKHPHKEAKDTKKEKRISVGNLTGYDDIVCEFAMCTFKLRNRVLSFDWLFKSEAKGVL